MTHCRNPITVALLLAASIFAVGCDSPFEQLTFPPPESGAEIAIKSDLYLAIGAKLNDQDINVLLDTGTVLFNLVPPSAIEKYGLKKSSENPYADSQMGSVGVCGSVVANAHFDASLYTADRLEIGGVVLENVAFVVLAEEGFDTFGSINVDCILNGGLLAQLDWRIDQFGRRLTLFPADTLARPDASAEIEVIGPNPPLLVDLIYGAVPPIGGITTFVHFASDENAPVGTVLDTGGAIELAMGQTIFDETGWNLADLPNIATGLFGAGGECKTIRFRSPFVSTNNQSYENVHTVILPKSEFGLMGWRFLANHETVNVSPKGRWIELIKGPDTDARFEAPIASYGFELKEQTNGAYLVSKVTVDSQADAAGVVKNDRLLEINGVNVETLEGKSLLFGPETMRAGEATFLFEDSNGDPFAVQLTAIPLI